jgi:hypothetical protein
LQAFALNHGYGSQKTKICVQASLQKLLDESSTSAHTPIVQPPNSPSSEIHSPSPSKLQNSSLGHFYQKKMIEYGNTSVEHSQRQLFTQLLEAVEEGHPIPEISYFGTRPNLLPRKHSPPPQAVSRKLQQDGFLTPQQLQVQVQASSLKPGDELQLTTEMIVRRTGEEINKVNTKKLRILKIEALPDGDSRIVFFDTLFENRFHDPATEVIQGMSSKGGDYNRSVFSMKMSDLVEAAHPLSLRIKRAGESRAPPAPSPRGFGWRASVPEKGDGGVHAPGGQLQIHLDPSKVWNLEVPPVHYKPTDLTSGELLNRYLVEQGHPPLSSDRTPTLLGRGGFRETYQHPYDPDQVIKIYRKKPDRSDELISKAMQQEWIYYQLLTKISSESDLALDVARIMDIDPRGIVVQEKIQGEALGWTLNQTMHAEDFRNYYAIRDTVDQWRPMLVNLENELYGLSYRGYHGLDSQGEKVIRRIGFDLGDNQDNLPCIRSADSPCRFAAFDW